MFTMFRCDFSSRRRRRMLANRLLIISSVIVLSVSEGYNEECYLPLERRQTLRMMVKNISRVFDKYGVQYWLDYGEFGIHFQV